MPSGKIKYLFAFFLLCSLFLKSYSSVGGEGFSAFPAAVTQDSVKPPEKKWTRAKTATIMSACLPGLGQAYNRKYWKIPVIYGLMGTFAYFTVQNHGDYKDYSNALRNRYDSDTNNDSFLQYSEEDLITLKRSSRRYRDLSILGGALIYVLQVVDANVDGHLSNFDVENISFNISPWKYNSAFAGRYSGVSLTLNFKN